METAKIKTFTRETQSKSVAKSREKSLYAQMSMLQNGQLASDIGF